MATIKPTTAPITGFGYCVAGLMISVAVAILAFGVWFFATWYRYSVQFGLGS
jgi:hypothetical protein